MSPPWHGCELQASLAVVEGDATIESLIDAHLGTGEVEAACPLRDLEAAAFPLHYVVVADDPFVHEAANTVDSVGSFPPGGCGFACLPGETELFVDGPVIVVANEDAAVITVKGQRHPVAAQHLSKQAEIAEGGFRGEELCGQDLSGGIVLHAKSSKALAAAFQPVVWAVIELHQFTQPCGTQAALAMSGSTAFAWRAETVLT